MRQLRHNCAKCGTFYQNTIKLGKRCYLKVNVEIPLRLIQQFAHHLINNRIMGSIINISSIAAIRPIVGSALNSCSKAGLDMLTKCAALELAKYQIRVNATRHHESLIGCFGPSPRKGKILKINSSFL